MTLLAVMLSPQVSHTAVSLGFASITQAGQVWVKHSSAGILSMYRHMNCGETATLLQFQRGPQAAGKQVCGGRGRAGNVTGSCREEVLPECPLEKS